MSVTLSPPMFTQFFDPNNTGAPAAGFKLFTYQAGTSIKQATWTDSTQGIQNPNPLILDASGGGNVWGDPTLAYKFVWAPANDTDPPSSPIRTQDNLYFPLNLSALTQSIIGTILYPRTTAEIASSVTPTNYAYAPSLALVGNIYRYDSAANIASNATNAIQIAVNSNKYVSIPDGSYTVTGGSINVPAGVTIFISSGATITCNPGSSNYIFNLAGNNTIIGGNFASTNDHPCVAYLTGAKSQVLLDGIVTAGPRLFYSTSATDTYSTSNDGNSPSGIMIRNCRGAANTVFPDNPWIWVKYARDWVVTGCSGAGYAHQIVFWGGDSSPGADGAITNDRKCRDGRIIGCGGYSAATGGAGIWGSMGKDITIDGCNTALCPDVGIDIEGCWDTTVTGCTSRDCTNSNFACFNYNRNITYVGCTSSLTGAAGSNHFYSANSALDASKNVDIQLLGCEFTSTSGSVIGLVGDGLGPVQGLKISNCRFHNARIAIGNTNAGSCSVLDNEFSFDTAFGQNISLISITAFGNSTYGRANVSIDRNRVVSAVSGAFGATAKFISCSDNDFNFTNLYSICGNENTSSNGPPIDLALTSSGGNAGNFPNWSVERNKFLNAYATGFTKTESGAGTSILNMRKNRDSTGAMYPNVTVASAATVTLPFGEPDFVLISGTTGITSITANASFKGVLSTLIFQGILTVTKGSNLALQSNFTTAGGSSLTILCDGVNWNEVGRHT